MVVVGVSYKVVEVVLEEERQHLRARLSGFGRVKGGGYIKVTVRVRATRKKEGEEGKKKQRTLGVSSSIGIVFVKPKAAGVTAP